MYSVGLTRSWYCNLIPCIASCKFANWLELNVHHDSASPRKHRPRAITWCLGVCMSKDSNVWPNANKNEWRSPVLLKKTSGLNLARFEAGGLCGTGFMIGAIGFIIGAAICGPGFMIGALIRAA